MKSIKLALATAIASDHHGEFFGEMDELFGHEFAGFFSVFESAPCIMYIIVVSDSCIAIAVITEGAGFDNKRKSVFSAE